MDQPVTAAALLLDRDPALGAELRHVGVEGLLGDPVVAVAAAGRCAAEIIHGDHLTREETLEEVLLGAGQVPVTRKGPGVVGVDLDRGGGRSRAVVLRADRARSLHEPETEPNPVGHLLGVAGAAVLAELDRPVAEVRLEIHLPVARFPVSVVYTLQVAAERIDRSGRDAVLIQEVHHGLAILVGVRPPAGRHEGIDLVFEGSVTPHDRENLLCRKALGVHVDMEPTRPVDLGTRAIQRIRHLDHLRDTLLTLEDRGDHLPARTDARARARHRAIVHDLPPGAGLVIVALNRSIDAGGAKRIAHGLLSNPETLDLDPELAIGRHDDMETTLQSPSYKGSDHFWSPKALRGGSKTRPASGKSARTKAQPQRGASDPAFGAPRAPPRA